MDLSNEIRIYARKRGADLVGITPIGRIKKYDIPQGSRSEEALPDAKSLIVMVKGMVPSVLKLIPSRVFDDYRYMTIYQTSMIACDIAKLLYDRNYDAVPISSYSPPLFNIREFQEKLETVVLRPAAVEAGLGEMGMNGVILTKDYGPRIFLFGVVTNAVLAPDKPFEEKLCDNCAKCIEVCPAREIGHKGMADPAKCINNSYPQLARWVRYVLKRKEIKDWESEPERMLFYLTRCAMQTLPTYCMKCIEVCPIGKNQRGIESSSIPNY